MHYMSLSSKEKGGSSKVYRITVHCTALATSHDSCSIPCLPSVHGHEPCVFLMNGLAHGSRLLSRQIVAILDCKVTTIAKEPHTA